MKRVSWGTLSLGVILIVLVFARLFPPGSEQPVSREELQPERGFAYLAAGKAAWPLKRMAFENGRPLREANTLDEVRDAGDGLYSWHPDRGLYFAPLDNIDPRNGEQIFTVRTFVFVRLRYIAAIILLLILSVVARRQSPWLLQKVNGILPPPGVTEKRGSQPKPDLPFPTSDESAAGATEDYGQNWNEFNLPARVWSWWIGVDLRYKTALAIAFPVTLLTFSIFTFHYLLNDHYEYLPAIAPDDQLFAGRWFVRFVNWLAAYANIPVFQQVVAMAFQLGAGIVALRLWGLRSLTSFGATLVLLIITVHPNNLTTYYYVNGSSLYTVSAFLAVCGMLVASQTPNGGWTHQGIWTVGGGILVCLAVATYQASMSAAATVAAGYAIMRLAECGGSLRNLVRRHFLPVWSMIAAGVLGGAFYLISLKAIGIKGVYKGAGGDMLALADLPRRFIAVTFQSFHALWVTQPEFNRPMKVALLAALLLAACFLAAAAARCYPGQKLTIAARWVGLGILLAGMIMATKTLFYTVSMGGLFIYRYNLAMPFLTAFCFYAIFATASVRRFGIGRSAAAIAACCIVFVFVRSDLLRQGILLAGHRHDLAIANRVLERVEALPGLDFSKRYYLVRLNPYSPERRRMLDTLHPYDTAGGSHMDVTEIGSTRWAAEVPFRVLGSRIQFKTILDNQHWNLKRARTLVKERHAKRWPDPSSVFVDGDMIVVNM